MSRAEPTIASKSVDNEEEEAAMGQALISNHRFMEGESNIKDIGKDKDEDKENEFEDQDYTTNDKQNNEMEIEDVNKKGEES